MYILYIKYCLSTQNMKNIIAHIWKMKGNTVTTYTTIKYKYEEHLAIGLKYYIKWQIQCQ